MDHPTLRTLPHRPEAENAVLGGIMLGGRDKLIEVLTVVNEEDFYRPQAQAVFRGMRILEERGEPIDAITLEAQLRRTGEFDLVGGIEGLMRLDRYATAHNIKAHADLILDAARQRRTVMAAREIAEEGMAEVEDVETFCADAARKVAAAIASKRKGSVIHVRQHMLGVFEGITERQRSTGQITGVSTGFSQLDEMTCGLQPTDLIILAARPSQGKTALALNMAAHPCILKQRHAHLDREHRPRLVPVLFFSLEMGAAQLVERVLCSEARVDYQTVRRGGRMMESDFKGLIAAADRITKSPLYIDDTAAPSILDIRERAMRWNDDPTIFPPDEEDQSGLVMIDYLQLARGGKAKYDSREQEISEVSRGLKALAKEIRKPVIALSQLNRAVDARADHRPQLSDLRESGAIEQDADVIMFIYREERYLNADAPEERRAAVENKAEIIVGKQRNGPIGTVHLNFIKQHTRFVDPADEQEMNRYAFR
jgi:replicative DNA helicase